MTQPLRAALGSFVFASALALGATFAAGCSSDPKGVPEGSQPDAGNDALPPPPKGVVDTPLPELEPATCDARAALVADCNYLHMYEVNSALSKEEKEAAGIVNDFDPTEACMEHIATAMPLDVTWAGADHVQDRHAILRALHTLLFHPLRVPSDLHLIAADKPGSPHFAGAFVADSAAPKMADGQDQVLTPKMWNEEIFYLIRTKVKRIQLANLTAEHSKMATDQGGNIYVNVNWVLSPEPSKFAPLQLNEVYKRYDVARVLFHEVRHAIHDSAHTGCDDLYGPDDIDQCDDAIDSAYGYGLQMGQALTLGALWTRLPNQDGPLVAPVTAHKLFSEACYYGLEQVNDFAHWFKNNAEEGLCIVGDDSAYAKELATLPKSSAASPRPADPVVGAWTCADSKNHPEN